MPKQGRKQFGVTKAERDIIELIKIKRRRRKNAIEETAFNRIANELNIEGYLTRDKKPWRAQTVKNILYPPEAPPAKKGYPKQQQPNRYWTQPEVDRLLEACRTDFERTIIYILVGSGMRASELIKLRKNDLVLRGEGSLIRVRKGKGKKGGKARSIIISSELADWLERYIETYRKHATEAAYLFVKPRDGDRLSCGFLYRVTTRIGRRAGFTETTNPHSFRHTFATQLYNYKQDIFFVQEQLGHSSVTVTAIYSKCINDSKIEQMRNFNKRVRVS